MTTINLVDWREKRRVVQNNRFFVMIGVTVFICMLLILMLDGIVDEMIGGNQSDVAYLSNQLAPVEEKIAQIKNLQTQKDLLLARRQVIESLQDSRPFVVRMFDNLARVVPAGVVLTELTRKDDQLSLSGVGNNNVDISEFLKNLQKLRWVNNAKLTEIKLNSDKSSAASVSPGNNAKNTQANNNNNNVNTNNLVSFKIQATLVSVDASVQDAAAKAIDAINPATPAAPGATTAPTRPGARPSGAKPGGPAARGAGGAPVKPGAIKPGAPQGGDK